MANFIDDIEKMRDFKEMEKYAFLSIYSYLTEEEYDETFYIMKKEELIYFINTQIENAKKSITDFPNIPSIHTEAFAKINVLKNVLKFIDENS